MDQKKLSEYIEELKKLDTEKMYNNDFFLTWEKTDDELKAVWTVADALLEPAREKHFHKGI